MKYKDKKLNINQLLKEKQWLFAIFIMLLATFSSTQNLAFYLHFDFNFTLCLILVPFVLFIKHKGHKSIRFGIISLAFLAFYPLMKMQSFFFFGFTFFLLFVIESSIGRLNNLPFFLLVLLSPVAIFAIEVFGFPIRLWLTDASAMIISFVNNDIDTLGNQIFVSGNKFSVDPECMGLKMVITGYLITLVMIAWFEKKTKNEISFFKVIIILFIASILIIISNLFRIIGIIFTKAPPETFLHEMVGIFSLVVYVIVPIYFICKLFYKKFAKAVKTKAAKAINKKLGFGLTIFLIGLLAFYNYTRDNYRYFPEKTDGQEIQIEGFQCNILKNGVTQLSNDSALIYIKKIPNFYSADHTPMVCWKGSGYKLQNQQRISIENNEIYFAELVLKGNPPLYTAWWYSNSKYQTINQMDWRWRMLKGEDGFSLVNVTCENKEGLMKKITDTITKF